MWQIWKANYESHVRGCARGEGGRKDRVARGRVKECDNVEGCSP